MSWKTRLGLIILALLVSITAGYTALEAAHQLDSLPECPLGSEPGNPFASVCHQVVGGLWRSLLLGVIAGAASCVTATALALLARRLGGWIELGIEKGAELFFSVPDLLVLIVLGFVSRAVWGGDGVTFPFMILSLVAIGWAAPTRMVQNRLRSLERLDFISAAHAIGVPRTRVLLRHVLPVAWDYLLAIFLLRVPAIILTESTVSYLGFGLPLGEPSLGRYLGAHWLKLASDDWMKVAPAWALLALVVVAFHQVGRGLLERAEEAR